MNKVNKINMCETVSGQLAPDNSPPIFKQLDPHSFIHYRVKQAAKYMNPRLTVIQIILRSFIPHQTNYSSFFYPLPSLKIGGELYDICVKHTNKKILTIQNPNESTPS